MVEAAIVLGVVGLVIGGIWVAAASVQENRRQSRMLEQITITTNNIRNNFPVSLINTSFTVTNLGAPGELVKNGWPSVVPEDMITGATNFPLTPWGTQVIIYVYSTTAVFYGTVYGAIVYNIYLPNRAACVAMAPRIYAMLQNEKQIYVLGSGNSPINTPALAATNCEPMVNNNGYIKVIFVR